MSVAQEMESPVSAPALFGPEMLADPYPAYHLLRSADPVRWHEPLGAWLLSRYDDVLSVLHDPRVSSDPAWQERDGIGGAGEPGARPRPHAWRNKPRTRDFCIKPWD